MAEDVTDQRNEEYVSDIVLNTDNFLMETNSKFRLESERRKICYDCQWAIIKEKVPEYSNSLRCHDFGISSSDIMGQNDNAEPLDIVNYLDADQLEEQKAELADFCRICHDADAEETLITPCRCKGTLSLVHRSCLERWLAASDSSNCELCGQFYITLRTPKYRYLASVISWIRSEENCRDIRELVLDLMALCVFTPMALLGTYLGLFAAENFYITETDTSRRDMSSARLVTLIVMSLMATIDLAYLSWLTVRTQYHVQQWYGWWRRQCTVKLFLPHELSPSSNERYFHDPPTIMKKIIQENLFSDLENYLADQNDFCSVHSSCTSRNNKEDVIKDDLGSNLCINPATLPTLTDFCKATIYDPARVESWCRICQESKPEVLVSPCRCRGTQGLVHLSCLERWLTVSGTSACEVCFFPYCVKTVPKYSPFISIFVWIYKGGNKKYMACDFSILLLLSTTMLWMIKHAWYLNKKENQQQQILSPGVAFLTAVFTIAYFFLVYSTIRYYYKKWLSWHKTNQLGLRVILPPDCRSVG